MTSNKNLQFVVEAAVVANAATVKGTECGTNSTKYVLTLI